MKSNTIRLRWLAIAFSAVCPTLGYAAPSATSAYMTDTQDSYVQDQTGKGIKQVNSIMCYLGAMAPDAMVNQGNYIALVDQTKCGGNQDSASNSGSNSSGSTASQYDTATVNSSRTSNTDPMIGKIWVDQNQQGQQQTIFVHASATAAPTSTNPYGVFRMDYCGAAASGGACMFNGFIDASSTGLSYYEADTSGGGSQTTAMTLNASDTTTGSGKMSIDQTGGGGSTSSVFTFAYNSTYFLRDDGVHPTQCFSRDATDPATGFSVWSYGLYNATDGSRVTRNSGFPIQYTSGGTTYQGYIGYWGLWLPQDVLSSIASGATVQKVTYSSGSNPTTTDYTLLKAGGKLTKYTKGTTTLAAIDQIRITFWAAASSGPSGLTGYSSGTSYEMYWDNTNSQFVITGVQTCGSNGCQMSSLTPLATNNSYWTTNYPYGINGWSQSVGGNLSINTSSLAGSSVVSYRTQDIVYPSQYASIGNLECIADCPTASGIAALIGGSASTPFGTTAGNYANTTAANLVTYTLDATTGNLIDGSSAPVTTASTALTGMYQNGIDSGELFAVSDANTVDGGNPNNYNVGNVDSLSVYYVWETGPNAWNQFSAVMDASGTFVQFDAPLNVNYTVPTGTAYGVYAGKTIMLQYNGFGDLQGIPGQCVNPVTNAAEDCTTANARYVPEFAIPFDQTTGTVTSGSTTYLVKWLNREVRLADKTVADCTAAGLSLPGSVILPTSAGLKDPSNSSSDVYIGAKPTVTTAPRVIQGIVQY
ncbi:MAG: hypothetical protein ACYC9J_07950 [Sulfuricaulis sp.]